jgi:RHS repeat-associated protein
MSYSIAARMLLALLLTLAPALTARAGEALILLSPDGLYYAPATINVKIQCVTDDEHFPKTVYLYLDDVLLRTSACDVPDYVLNLPRGQYALRTNAVDVHGHNLNEQWQSFSVLIPGDLPPSITLHPIAGGPYSAPATIPLSVTAADSDGQVVSVEYFANNQSIGTTTQAPFQFSWSAVAAGSYSITAKATDNSAVAQISQPRTVTVEPMSVPGYIDGVRDNGPGGYEVYGWACLVGTSASIDVQLFARDTEPNGGVLIGTVRANQASESPISTACRTSGIPHRFSFTLTEAIRRAHPNKKLFAYGVGAGANVLLGQSGQHSIPGWQLLSRRFVYDQYQQLCKTIEPETGATVMEYDAAGNPSWSAAGLALPDAAACNRAEAQASGRVVTRTYDKRNRIKNLNFPDGVGNQVWSYRADGLPTSITTSNPGSSTPTRNTYSYNRLGLLTSDMNSNSQSMNITRNGYGNIEQLTYQSGIRVSYTLNALGQPTLVREGPAAQVFASSISYYPNGALKSLTYGNGIVHTMQQNMRQLPMRSSDSGALDLQTDYDANGNAVRIRDVLRGETYDRSMEYDDLDRLQTAKSCSFGGDCWHRFSYDALDNLKSWSLGGVKDHRYYYDTRNQLTNLQNANGASVAGLDYDMQGNLANKNGRQFRFDYGNRLREIVGLDSYSYDGWGRRTNVYRNSVEAERLSYNRWGQLTQRNFPPTSTRIDYIYLEGNLIASRQSEPGSRSFKYHHTDMLGSPVAVTNQAGQVIDRTEWEPYGAAIGRPAYDGIGYAGHLMDAGSGLSYMQQRYYDPMIGRFLSVDPVSVNSHGGTNFNRYWYANNNPYRFTDPDGRYVCSGGKTDCGNFDKAINMAKEASTSPKLSEGQRTALSAAVAFFGDKGKAGVEVSFGDLKGDAAQINTNRKGEGTVTFDLKAIAGKSAGVSGTVNGLAMRSLHEGDHGVRIINEDFPGSRSDRLDRERSGYRAEAFYQKAMGFLQNSNNLWAPWNPGDGIDEGAVNARAKFSVMSSCSGSSEGSCR